MKTFRTTDWAVIIGGSGGFGLATVRKLAHHGMNLCIVHRDRRGAMTRIGIKFDGLKATGVDVLTFNLDGLSQEGRALVLEKLTEALGPTGKVRLLLHAVAFGNLKLLFPPGSPDVSGETTAKLAAALDVSPERLRNAVHQLFDDGEDILHSLASPPAYPTTQFLEEEDFTRTLQAMGFNIVQWVQDIRHRGLFAPDARVLSLTSEGNRIAWRGYAAVSAAKATLESVSRSMAVEFAPYGIRSNVIQAGVTNTAALQMIPGNKQIKARAAMRNPLGRLTRPEDVADVIYLLCLDEAAWVNGALICVDGGECIA